MSALTWALWVLVGTAVLGSGVLTGSRAVDAGGVTRSPVPQLAAFAPWAVPGWAVAVVLAAALQERWLLLLAAAALVLQLIWTVPPRPSSPVVTGGRPMVLVTFNALLGRADRAAVLELVARSRADVLAVQELTPELAADLDPMIRSAGLDHADLHPGPSGTGTGVWSRWPLAPLGLLPSSRCAMPRVRLQPPTGVPVTVTVVHTQAPNPRRMRGWRDDLALLARHEHEHAQEHARVSPGAGPRIQAGDFNASRDHAAFRAVLATGLVDAADVAGRSPQFTWPANLRRLTGVPGPVLTRLDHVLVSPDIQVTGVRTVTVPGSDHRAVVAELVV